MPETVTTIARPAYRPYRATVTAVEQLTPHFVRVTFTGDDFDVFAEHARDQRIKIVFPRAARCFDDLGVDDEAARQQGDWYQRWRELPDDHRSPFRTYTVRTIDATRKLLQVDFVAHHDTATAAGPGGEWLSSAQPGHQVIVVGPDARSEDSHIGMDWHPGNATEVLLLGDETAAPAIAGILEQLPPHQRATALIEVPSAEDAPAIDAHDRVDVTCLAREGRPIGSLLESALRDWVAGHTALVTSAATPRQQQLEDVDVDTEILWESPNEEHDGGFYAWLAGESAAIKKLRRILVSEVGIDRHRVAFMGYWRQGQAERSS